MEHFICPHTYKHVAKLVRVDVADGGSFIVRRPVEHVNSTDLILGAYNNCARDGDNIDVTFQVVSWSESFGGRCRIAPGEALADDRPISTLGFTIDPPVPVKPKRRLALTGRGDAELCLEEGDEGTMGNLNDEAAEYDESGAQDALELTCIKAAMKSVRGGRGAKTAPVPVRMSVVDDAVDDLMD